MNKKQMKLIEKIQKLKERGALTNEEFNKEKEKILKNNNNVNNNKLVIIIAFLIILLLISIVYMVVGNSKKFSNKGNKQKELESSNSSSNIQMGQLKNISFGNYNSENEEFNEIQKDIIDYYNNDYMPFSSFMAERYPQMFKGAKVTTYVRVVKVLKSTDEEFEVICADLSNDGWKAYYESVEQIPSGNIIEVKGKQLNKRLMHGDKVMIYGKYNDVATKEIDGKTYMVSQVEADYIQGYHYDETDRYELLDARFSFETIKNIAEFIFGKDIKISKTYEESNFYKVVLDDQSNINFKSFNMFDDIGCISYDYEDNNLDYNITKKLFVSADFQHYLVSTHDENTQHVYVEYYNREYEKLWKREFDYNSTKSYVSPMDYNNEILSCVIDNDLYLIDLKTGENIIDPIIVGEKIRVLMMDDGILLIGDNSKDIIMKVDYSGKIIVKNNIKFENELDSIMDVYLQVKDDNIVISLTADTEQGIAYKYILMKSDGTIESISEDELISVF